MAQRIDVDRAEELHARGWTLVEIAESLGCAPTSVGRALRQRGIASSRRWRRMRRRHGGRLYGLWRHLLGRCEDPSHRDYGRYGAKGIRLARAWHDFDAFYDWAIESGYVPGLKLARKNRSRNFIPSNCEWVEEIERPPAPEKFAIRAFGESKGQMAWARDPRCRVKQPALRDRLAAGWPPEEAIALPPGSRPSRTVRPPKPLTRPRRRRARIDWPEAKRLYLRERRTEAEIARTFGATEDAVARGLARLGVRRRRPPARTYDREWRRLEKIWRDLRERARARRIPLAPEWREFERFHEWARASGARKGLWLTRKTRRYGYTPGNCEWVPRAEATRRRMRGI